MIAKSGAGCSIAAAPQGRVVIIAQYGVGKFPGMHLGQEYFDLPVVADERGRASLRAGHALVHRAQCH
jgi:hypothetical protein